MERGGVVYGLSCTTTFEPEKIGWSKVLQQYINCANKCEKHSKKEIQTPINLTWTLQLVRVDNINDINQAKLNEDINLTRF